MLHFAGFDRRVPRAFRPPQIEANGQLELIAGTGRHQRMPGCLVGSFVARLCQYLLVERVFVGCRRRVVRIQAAHRRALHFVLQLIQDPTGKQIERRKARTTQNTFIAIFAPIAVVVWGRISLTRRVFEFGRGGERDVFFRRRIRPFVG